MAYRTLIRNGTIVDGTGASAYAADVRIRGGRIVEIGRNLALQPDERAFDATGCYVTPGFIEPHNHWDAAVWWSPNMEPFPGYGVTTSINGNCGFSLAPLPPHETGKQDIVDIFNFFEDKAADIVVFNLDEIARRDEVKIWDIPDGIGGRTYRYIRPAAPMRLTMVAGVPAFDNGEFTGKFPGAFIGRVHEVAQAMAAE